MRTYWVSFRSNDGGDNENGDLIYDETNMWEVIRAVLNYIAFPPGTDKIIIEPR